MNGAPRDRDLEGAQQEIQRRLVRGEKPESIEDEEVRLDPAQVITPRVDPFTLEPREHSRLEKSLAAGRFVVIATVRGVPTRQHPISPDSRTNVTAAVDVDRRQQGGEVIEDALGMDNVVIGEGVHFEVRADGHLHPVEVWILNASNFKVKIEVEIREEKRI